MERLQIAIAKARAAREEAAGKPAGDAPRPGPGGTARRREGLAREAAGADATAEAWAAIERFDAAPAQLERSRIVTAAGGRAATEFDKLRTRIVQRMQAEGWTRLAVTSPGPGCGKSTITMNLGYGLARQDATRVVMCEMDLRRPSLAALVGAPTGRDFAAVLEGRSPFGEEALRLRPNLAAGLVERSRRDTAELLQGRSTVEALDRIQAALQPTAMLIDTPPVLVSDDTIGLVANVDCALIVAAAGATTIAEIDACEREVAAQCPVLGVVLNKCRFSDEASAYEYYYD